MIKISLSNFQSHHNTSFKLSKGVNIIWSDWNNVGKSTIFRALDVLVRASKYTGQELKELIRWGKSEASIICEYDNNIVELLIFIRNTTASYKFIHTIDNNSIELTNAPNSLITKLDLLYDEKFDNVINIIEADKTQLVVQESNLTDGIMSTIFFDDRLEFMKENTSNFNKVLDENLAFYKHNKNALSRSISNQQLDTSVDMYNSDKPLLEKLVLICDCVSNYKNLRIRNITDIERDTKLLTVLTSLCHVHRIINATGDCVSPKEFRKLQIVYKICTLNNIMETLVKMRMLKEFKVYAITHMTLTALMTLIRFAKLLKVLRTVESELKTISNMYKYIMILNTLGTSIKNEKHLSKDILSVKLAYKELCEYIEKQSLILECPVKGRVIYSDEKCIPYTD